MRRDNWDPWLDRDLTDAEAVLDLAAGIDADELMEHQVSKDVNNVRNDGPGLRVPAVPETLF